MTTLMLSDVLNNIHFWAIKWLRFSPGNYVIISIMSEYVHSLIDLCIFCGTWLFSLENTKKAIWHDTGDIFSFGSDKHPYYVQKALGRNGHNYR